MGACVHRVCSRGFLLVSCLVGGLAPAASISGTVTNTSSAPLPGMEVRAWHDLGKGYVIATLTTTDGAGNYTLSVGAGPYKIDARMGAGTTGDYGDRWYDVAAPTGNGYIEALADTITVADPDVVTGINLVLEVNGGLDGTISTGAGLYAGPEVRLELKADVRNNHNDFAQPDPHLGEYHFRGMVPGDYRLLAWDLNGLYETYVSGGPWTISSAVDGSGPAVVLTPMAADPNEPNDGPTGTRSAIDSTLFRQTPPQPFSTSGALIGPRGSDVDWYCFDAKAHDRFFITAQGVLTLEDGSTRPHPYVDPVVALFDVTSGTPTKLKEDDDSGPVPLAAKLDTGPFANDGRYCAVVSTYGDTGYNGAAQGSAGRYQATIVMGNRSPAISGTWMSRPVPVAPQVLTINEGDTLNVDVTFSDPDGDPVTAGWDFVDSGGMGVSSGTFTGAGSGTFTWTASQIAARRSPYTLTLHVADAEFTTNLVVTVVVNEVNVPPSTPVLLSPADRTVVANATPQLVCGQSTDLDLDPLTYRFELYYGDDAGIPAQTAWITPDGGSPDGGTVGWTVTTIPEDTHCRWRARAVDGNTTNGYSPWSGFFSFVMSTVNDPPPAPAIVKPADGDTVIPIRPTIEVSNPVDPEGQAVSVFIQVASDSAFTTGVIASGGLPTAGAPFTMWTVTQDLVWGQTYYVRAWALDSDGAQSAYSATVRFTMKTDAPPTAVAPDEPFVAKCDDLRLDAAPKVISVTPATDPDNDPITIELSIFKASDDPDTATPVFHQSVAQAAAGSTAFDTSMVTFTPGVKYRVRVRAGDGFLFTPWTDCYLTVGTGTHSTTSKGCHCGGVEGSLLALLALLRVVTRRPRPTIHS